MNIVDVNKLLFEWQGSKKFDIFPGDIVTVSEKIVEQKKIRIQKFQGIVISNTKKNSLSNSILIRKKFQNFWLEKKFFVHSPMIEEIVVDTPGKSRRAVLNYLREKKHLSQKLKRLKK